MWIKNQDGNTLLDTCKISYFESDSGPGYEFVCQTNTSLYILGRYSTKEKAMKVMDMIKNAITGTRFEFTDIVRDCDLAGIEIHNVFNMPKDEEVE